MNAWMSAPAWLVNCTIPFCKPYREARWSLMTHSIPPQINCVCDMRSNDCRSGWDRPSPKDALRSMHLECRPQSGNHIAEFLERTSREQAEKKNISVALTVIGDARDLHPIVRDEISRIAAEGIRNACLHSNASQLTIELRYARDLSLSIKDNGVGMDPELAGTGKIGHYGIQGMKERSARIRARITITSTLNAGTQILVNVPGDLVYRREKKSLLQELRAVRFWSRRDPDGLLKVRGTNYTNER